MKRLAVGLLLLCPLFAQTSNANDGLSAPWQLKQRLENLTGYCRRLSPIVDQLRPADWRDASAGYIEQQQVVRGQLDSIVAVAGRVMKEPEGLPGVMDLYFRYENFDLMLSSLLEGVRRYQNPAIADLITGMRAEHAGVRQSLKDYMVELAAVKDQQFRLADIEAQRCRAGILKQPVRRQ